MNYWLSDALTPDGSRRIAAFNIREEDEGLFVPVALVNAHTEAGEYRLSNGSSTITLVLPPEWATQAGYLVVTDELWETT